MRRRPTWPCAATARRARALRTPGRDDALAATDTGGSGVGTIRWTVDGTDPKIDRGNEYQGTFSVESLTHLKRGRFTGREPERALAVTVKSLANRLLFAAPAAVVVAHVGPRPGADDLQPARSRQRR
jgi:hypothetical protein